MALAVWLRGLLSCSQTTLHFDLWHERREQSVFSNLLDFNLLVVGFGQKGAEYDES